jgi:hypothetical protein
MYGMEDKGMKLTNKKIHTDSHGRTSLINVPPRELYLRKNTGDYCTETLVKHG